MTGESGQGEKYLSISRSDSDNKRSPKDTRQKQNTTHFSYIRLTARGDGAKRGQCIERGVFWFPAYRSGELSQDFLIKWRTLPPEVYRVN